MDEEIYEPAEDSYLLASQVKIYSKTAKNILDMGTGSGIQAETARKVNKSAKIDAVDINKQAISKLKKNKLKIKAYVSDLFEKIDLNKKYDLIIFNTPYLPSDSEKQFNSNKWSGGKEGIEVTLRFFKQAKKHLSTDGKILFTYSSLSNTEKLMKELTKLGFDIRNLDFKEFLYEIVFVAEASFA